MLAEATNVHPIGQANLSENGLSFRGRDDVHSIRAEVVYQEMAIPAGETGAVLIRSSPFR